jgi:hypothetical protein
VELQQLPHVVQVPEDGQAEFAAAVVNCGNVPVSYEVHARSNLGEDLGVRQGQLAPGAGAMVQWSVVGRYGQTASQEPDAKATLTAVHVRLRHTDLSGQWREALDGAQTVPVKVKAARTKLGTDALRGFDDL